MGKKRTVRDLDDPEQVDGACKLGNCISPGGRHVPAGGIDNPATLREIVQDLPQGLK